jgi:sterol desaturase/sphingolipid hydroxylase (fatty acid hydroxylase superfamily)
MDVIQASIPLFFLLIGVELLVARVRGQKLYRLNDSIADLSCGTASQLVGVFVTLLTIGLYRFVADHLSIQGLFGASAWPDRTPFPPAGNTVGFGLDAVALAFWGLAFVLDDLAYYWTHRYSHEVNILWAGHVVHHSSEEYNLTVALRQSSLHGLLSWVFYMPLAMLGIPVGVWVVCHAVNLIYQFWIHTREISRLGPLEAVMNTPSHHRVHHGVNPQYQDKNYAGVFIIWDRLFGTFEPEVEEPVYGITKPLASWNPIWANLHVLRDLVHNARLAARWPDKLRIIFGRPGWKPPELGPSETPRPVSAATYRKYDPPVPRSLKVYATAQFAVVVVAATILLAKAAVIPWLQVLAGVFYLVVALSNIGAIFEGRSWAAVSEVARLVVLGGAVGVLALSGRGPAPALAGALLFTAASAGWILWLRPSFAAGPRA